MNIQNINSSKLAYFYNDATLQKLMDTLLCNSKNHQLISCALDYAKLLEAEQTQAGVFDSLE